MKPVVAVAGAWILFGGTHLLLSWPPMRAAVSNKLGDRGFLVTYTLVAAVTVSLLAVAVASYGAEGPPGFNLAEVPVAKWGLAAVAFVGATLMVAGLVNYGRSPMAVLARRLRAGNAEQNRPLADPAFIERITRHPFFVGLVLLMGAHALLASTLSVAVFFAGFVLLALIGMPMQDRKLRERHSEVYGAYLESTSAMPFTASRRASIDGTEHVWNRILIAILGAGLLAALHVIWIPGHGAWFAVLVAVGGTGAVVRQLRHM